MTLPWAWLKALWQMLTGPWCHHHRAQNPDEPAWKPCCKLDSQGLQYRCCECGKHRSMWP
jgi:hypothetical protein